MFFLFIHWHLLEYGVAINLFVFQGLFTYMYIVSILFLLYVFCFLLHEYSCCGGPPQGTSGRNTYFQVGDAMIFLSDAPFLSSNKKWTRIIFSMKVCLSETSLNISFISFHLLFRYHNIGDASIN